MKKRIAIIGTVGVPAKYGGFETLTEYLTKYLASEYKITVYCSSKSYETKLNSYNGSALKYINLKANGAQSIPYDILSIFDALKSSDTLVILGVSGCIVLPFIKLFSKKRVVINIDGLEWKRDKWGKLAKLFLKYSEKLAVTYSDVIVSDNKVIQEYVRSEYHKESKYIAYGADHVSKEQLSDSTKKKYRFLCNPYAFKVCRIEPENNIHIILEAFYQYKKLNLVIIGNWSNSKYGQALRNQYSKIENIFLLDPIYNQNILNQIRSNAYVYIHGHSAGGTNPSLVEAMYLGLPIMAFGVEYNKETTHYKALYFDNKEDLQMLLKNTSKTDLQDISENMQIIANKNYAWKIITKQYSNYF
jgi:glycosyltransferase involved in cell wall biosynthesis